MSFKWDLAWGMALRLLLVGFGEVADRMSSLKYSDVDYSVFTDGARYVWLGQSPYTRHTYRYSPFLAYLMLPNLWCSAAGKLLFSVFDILTAVLLYQRMHPERDRRRFAWLWTFNPFVFIVSTRGSFDSLVAPLLLLAIEFAQKRRFCLSAVMLGLAAHVRIYPILLAPSFLLALASRRIFSTSAVGFALLSAAIFISLAGISVWMYGAEFMREALLYHVSRRDHRHNYSLLFMLMYTQRGLPPLLSAALTLPFILLCGVCALAHRHRLHVALFLVALLIVTFNKVVTAQYFIWVLQLLPLALAELPSIPTSLVSAGMLWAALAFLWNNIAHRLEARGEDVLLPIHLFNCLFFATNVWIIWKVSSLAGLIASPTLRPEGTRARNKIKL